jgi:hypothetical protein
MTETKTDSREKLIDWLIQNDMDYFDYEGGKEWFKFILRNGCIGYDSLTDDELLSEILERDPDFSLEEVENA